MELLEELQAVTKRIPAKSRGKPYKRQSVV